jgi:hypothetical protein
VMRKVFLIFLGAVAGVTVTLAQSRMATEGSSAVTCPDSSDHR